MISAFKLWLENEGLDSFLEENSKAKAIYDWLLRKPEIRNLMKEIDDQNLLISRQPGQSGILYTNGFRIPIVLVKSSDPKYIGLKRVDGKDFSEINNLWPFYPNKNDRTIIEVNKETRIINNDNAGNFCKLIARFLSNSDEKIEILFEKFWKEYQTKLEYIAGNPRLITHMIEDGKFDEKMFSMDSLEVGHTLEFDPTEREGREDFHVVMSFPDGLYWVENSEFNYGLEPKLILTLVDDNYKNYAEIILDNNRNITGNNFTRAFENNTKLFLPYLKAILMSDRIHGCRDFSVFPGPYFDQKEKHEIIQANPRLKDDDRVEILLNNLEAGGEKRDNVIAILHERVPKLKEFEIVGVDRNNFVILTNKKQEKDFDWEKAIDLHMKVNQSNSVIDEYIVYAPDDIIESMIRFVNRLIKNDPNNIVYSQSFFDSLAREARNASPNDKDSSKREKAIEDITNTVLRHISRAEYGQGFIKNINQVVRKKEIKNNINKTFSSYCNELVRFVIKKEDVMTASATLAISPFILDTKVSLGLDDPEVNDNAIEYAIKQGFKNAFVSIGREGEFTNSHDKKELKLFFKLFREMLAYFWNSIKD